ncbi:MAG TPA: hypothetical protein EYQ50_04330 [Verrucomicrobiales bacterium]|nr:hypothetical protein [Verrucomicrobiales bacterium]
MSLWKVIAATLLIYSAGILTGTFLSHWKSDSSKGEIGEFGQPPIGRSMRGGMGNRHGERGPESYFINAFMRRMKGLDLNENQVKQIKDILKTSHSRTKDLRDSISSPLKDEYEKVKEEIRAELTPKQKERFEESFKQRRGFGNGPSPGGRSRGGFGGSPREKNRSGSSERERRSRPPRPEAEDSDGGRKGAANNAN